MAAPRNAAARQWARFRDLPLLAQAVIWAAIGSVLALGALALDDEAVDERPAVGTAEPGPVRRTPPPEPRESDREEDETDPQVAPGSLPAEVRPARLPKNWRATSANVRRLFNRTLGGRGRAGLLANRLVRVRCSKGNCRLEYVPDGPGAGRIIEAQGVLWKAFLEDPAWRKATIVAHPGGPDLAAATENGRRPEYAGAPFVTITCTRSGAQRAVDGWGVQGAPQIETVCDVNQVERPGR